MTFYSDTFKHGVAGYNTHRCRCEVCRSAKRLAESIKRERRRGTEPPEHGTANGYVHYGCRCEICAGWRRKAYDSYRKSRWGTEPPQHGMTGYHAYGCRCEICVSAKKQSDMERRLNPQIVAREKERSWARQGIKNFTYDDFCKKYDEQEGKCAICGGEMKKSNAKKSAIANVDHDHATGKTRSLLCNGCNKMLGCGAKPSVLRKGADYLELHGCGEKV